jgi:glutamate synthase domain-containing protein 1
MKDNAFRMNAAGIPEPSGLYDPENEHDSCGVGFVARIDGVSLHLVVRQAVQVLVNLEHRGALGGDKATGDGAGIMVGIPDIFFRHVCPGDGLYLPPVGDYAVGTVFLPTDEALEAKCRQILERVSEKEGCPVLGWREVPVDPSVLGDLAGSTRPAIRQLFLARGKNHGEAFERKLYAVRRVAEKEASSLSDGDASQFYIASLSSRTLVYKGLLTGTQLPRFYPDLENELFMSPFAVVHQRYSTNTLPTWHLAHPFRICAHNGEINTLRGNINRMRAREATLSSPLLGEDLRKILPVIDETGSDSAIFDNALELLVTAGRSLPHAVMRMSPEAWGPKSRMSEDKRAFYEYHSTLMEPWDGPAAMVFCDGRYLGATLDRNGLRPARYTITRDGLIVLASETGVIDFPADRIIRRGRLRPGKMLLLDMKQKRIVPDQEIKAAVSRRKPYRNWVKENRIELRGLFLPPEIPPEDPEELLRKQHAFGYTDEEVKLIVTPMASQGQEPVGSMGDDAALAVLSNRPQVLFGYFKQLFAQVTNPPIDPLRETLVMSLTTYIGREQNLLDETPKHCRMLRLVQPILTPEDMQRLRNSAHPDLLPFELDATFPADGDGKTLETALARMFVQADKAIGDGHTVLIVSHRKMSESRAPIPSLLAAAGLHHHLIRRGLRTQAAILVESGEPREVMNFALLLGYGANAICPHTVLSTIRDLAESGMLENPLPPGVAVDKYITAVKKGLLKTFSRMGISTLRSFLGSQIFEAVGLGRSLVETYFTHTASRIGGIGLAEIAAETVARHRRGYPVDGRLKSRDRMLDVGGVYKVRVHGERPLWPPESIYTLQAATRQNDYAMFRKYAGLINDQAREHATLRSLFRFRKGTPVPVDEVEPVEKILPRFLTAAMSFGSISKETHETIAIAMNRIGGRSNSGEGRGGPGALRADAQRG